MNNSDKAFRESFIKLIEERNKMSKEELTSESNSDNIVEVGEAEE